MTEWKKQPLEKTFFSLKAIYYLFIALLILSGLAPFIIYHFDQKIILEIFDGDESIIQLVALAQIMVTLILFFVISLIYKKLVKGLEQKKYGAWIGSLIIFIISLPSIFIPFSILGLYDLFHPETRKLF